MNMDTWGKPIEKVLQHFEQCGFDKVLELPFVGDEDRIDTFYVYFHKVGGILLIFDTFGDHINSGHYYYQWKPKHGIENYPSLQNGGWKEIGGEWIWEGYGDCREGMIWAINELSHQGTFITPWVKHDGIFKPDFTHYGDHHKESMISWDAGYEAYKKACKEKAPERMNMLPEYVKEAIKASMWRN
jgi:hypothetical protein